MKFVIGIDGGGTKTILKIADINGNILAISMGGPSNINSVGKQYVENILKGLIFNAVSKINEKLENCIGLCIGTAGAGRDKDRKIIEKIIRNIGYKGELIITNDATTLLYGNVGLGEGIAIISGTGSICLGKNNKGQIYRSGGWGHIIGDEGSGYYIGAQILKHIMKSYDKREAPTILAHMVLDELKYNNEEQLIEYVYRSNIGKKEIAQFTKLIDKAYTLNDPTAIMIVKDAAYELFLCTKSVIEYLKFEKKIMPLFMSGSVLNKSKYVRLIFQDLIYNAYPQIEISNVDNDAAWGAVLIILDQLKKEG